MHKIFCAPRNVVTKSIHNIFKRAIVTETVQPQAEVPIVSHETPSSSCSSSCTPAEVPRKKQLMQYTMKELEVELKEMGLEKFRAQQIYKWVYTRGAISFDVMTDLRLDMRQKLAETFDIVSPTVSHVSKSTDGTRKYLMKVHPRPGKGEVVETVFIPSVGAPHLHDAHLPSPNSHKYPSRQPSAPYLGEEQGVDDDFVNPDLWDRGSVCVSSQIGCSLQCAFCHTGTMPKSQLRNLLPEEIVGQIMLAKHDLGDYTMVPYDPHDIDPISNLPKGLMAQKAGGHVLNTAGTGQTLYKPIPAVSNIVLMGMGEPGYNYNNVKKALNVLLDPNGLAFGRRRITLSTSGVVPVIDKLGQEVNVNLAISLHAVRNDIRDILVPINKQFPLEVLMEACRRYPGVKNSRVVTWEYVMLEGVNDSDEDARELVRLLGDIPSLVNLIPFNPWPGSKFKCSSMERIRRFQNIVMSANQLHIKCSIRTPRGRDILAACGQLAIIKNAQSLETDQVSGGVGVGVTVPNQQNLPHAQHEALDRLLNKQ